MTDDRRYFWTEYHNVITTMGIRAFFIHAKDRESLRLFAESKALMTFFDLTIFFKLAEFAI